MSAASLARALGGHRAGRDWIARCPAHADKTPSLAIREGRDGRVLLKCHAGCTQWDVIGALKDRGIWMADGGGQSFATPRRVADVGEHRRGDVCRTAFAMQIWDECLPARGTLVETYFRSRGLEIAPPASLRFHPALKHPTGGTWPAMVAHVTRGTDGTPIGIHRTFLARDGAGKAPVVPQKMMLGPCRGGTVRLGECTGGDLRVGEGIETCLAVMQATGPPAWAALSTSGLRSLDLPVGVDEVVILADGDDPGEAAARAAARRWRSGDRRVRIARPPAGMDFNDVLLLGAAPQGAAL
jgi:hypothetical protein